MPLTPMVGVQAWSSSRVRDGVGERDRDRVRKKKRIHYNIITVRGTRVGGIKIREKEEARFGC